MKKADTHTLVVVANPDPGSLSQHLAHELVVSTGKLGTAELADLCREGFDPRWTMTDRLAYQGLGTATADVVAEQRRLDRATDVILVFPVYWWSAPALLKGWIDRVFISGWAFGYTPTGGIDAKLQRLTIHVIPVAGSDAGAYERHGYEQAIRTQFTHGLIEFCGATQGSMAFLYESEDPSQTKRTHHYNRVVSDVIAAVTERKSLQSEFSAGRI